MLAKVKTLCLSMTRKWWFLEAKNMNTNFSGTQVTYSLPSQAVNPRKRREIIYSTTFVLGIF